MVAKKLVFIALFLEIFFLSFVSAGFSVGNPKHGLETIYGPSGNITGWINLSFASEPITSVFSDSRNNEINLSGILKKNAVFSYLCSPLNCKDDYTTSSPSQTKTIALNLGNSKTYGVRLTGNIFGIESFKFTLDSNAGPSCTSQVDVDLMDNSVLDARNTNSSEERCTNLKDYGCFNSGWPTIEEFTIGTTPYCQKVALSSSPGFFIGGWVKKVSGSRILKASIYDSAGGGELANCILPNASSSGIEISCGVSYSVISPKDHYVCISSTSGSGDYKVRGYTTSNGCGFYGTPVPSTMPAAYQIFAQGKSFGSAGTIEINKSIGDGRILAELAEEYIIEKYGTQDCSLGCIIPIKISSNLNQDITLRDLQVNYQKESGLVTESNFYDVAKTPAKVNSPGFQKLYLDGSGFSAPSSTGDYYFSLRLNNQSVVSQQMEVKNIPIIKSLTPVKTAAAFPTEFTVNVASNYNLTRFSWRFGDGSPEMITSGNNASHTYDSIGVYNLVVNVTDERQLTASKVFVMNVSSPKDLINLSLYEIERDISNLENEVSTFAPFYQDVLSSSLNLGDLKETVGLLKDAYQNAISEEEYNVIVKELISLKIPEGIAKSRSTENFPFFSGPDYINLPVIQEIGGGSYDADKEEEYINGVLLWQRENLDIVLDFNEFSVRYQDHIEPITRIFEINVNEKKDIPYDYYLILPELEGFKTDAEFNVESGYIYINLKEDNPISFSTTEDVGFAELPAFISPALSRVTVVEEILPEEKPKWTIFILVVFLLLIIGIVAYIIMQGWYKRKYEDHLFPNRNDLYNMIHYVNNAKKKGLRDGEIRGNLEKAGWSSERIRYVMKKYAGKRTGMLEIPITRLAEKAGGKPRHQK